LSGFFNALTSSSCSKDGTQQAHIKKSDAKMKKPLQITDLHRFFTFLAEWTGLEPATPGVTGRYSNQLNYHSW
jgi:hypothetical protein